MHDYNVSGQAKQEYHAQEHMDMEASSAVSPIGTDEPFTASNGEAQQEANEPAEQALPAPKKQSKLL